MKQILQNLKTGATEIADIPCPQVRAGHLLIRTRSSLISAGTERMLVEFGKAGLINKVRQQPDKVRMVLDKITTDGLMTTVEAVRQKLDQAIPMGYCNVGEVIAVGSDVIGFEIGERVASNGPHAEMVCVPKNLCARIPPAVSDEAAVFTVVGAIALQGIRLALPTLGESFMVTGLGLVGLLTAQLLRAHGCRVLGSDYDPARLELARQFGVEPIDLARGEDPLSAARIFSKGQGIDGVLITASTTSNDPVHQAAQMCRRRGRIILIGVTGLHLSREDFYEKELTFQVSCSYGPGRYDPVYEEQGQDYPPGFVRWTEQRNFEAVLEMMSTGSLDTAALVSHRFPIDQAVDAYACLDNGSSSLGILIQYPASVASQTSQTDRSTISIAPSFQRVSTGLTVGVIGAGDFAGRILLSAFQAAGVSFKTIASTNGLNGTRLGHKFGFEETTTDTDRIIADPRLDVIVIATRHDSHARFVCQALQAGKHVFVEKPLAITREQLAEVEGRYAARYETDAVPIVMVGFNRRFAPHIRKIKTLLDTVHEPKNIVITINAGEIPAGHWLRNPAIGGGRIVGEGCHFIDLLRFLAGHPITDVQSAMMKSKAGSKDTISFTLSFSDGSCGTVHYLSNGHKSFPKERIEVFCSGRILQLDNFRCLRGYGWPGFKRMRAWKQDKGHTEEVSQFINAIQQGDVAPIPFEELVEVTRTSFEII